MVAPIIFDRPGDFASRDAATAALTAAGFSIGSNQRGAPTGLLLGDVSIAKWRNLSHQERRDLDGELFASREGPATVIMSAAARPEVVAAFDRVRAAAQQEPADA